MKSVLVFFFFSKEAENFDLTKSAVTISTQKRDSEKIATPAVPTGRKQALEKERSILVVLILLGAAVTNTCQFSSTLNCASFDVSR